MRQDASILELTTQGLTHSSALSGSVSLLSGTVKLLQKVVLELLTERGSQLYAPSRGSSLVQRLRETPPVTEFHFLGLVASAILEVTKNISQDETLATPAEERLAKLEVYRLALLPENKALVTLALTTQATSKTPYQTTFLVNL